MKGVLNMDNTKQTINDLSSKIESGSSEPEKKITPPPTPTSSTTVRIEVDEPEEFKVVSEAMLTYYEDLVELVSNLFSPFYKDFDGAIITFPGDPTPDNKVEKEVKVWLRFKLEPNQEDGEDYALSSIYNPSKISKSSDLEKKVLTYLGSANKKEETACRLNDTALSMLLPFSEAKTKEQLAKMLKSKYSHVNSYYYGDSYNILGYVPLSMTDVLSAIFEGTKSKSKYFYQLWLSGPLPNGKRGIQLERIDKKIFSENNRIASLARTNFGYNG